MKDLLVFVSFSQLFSFYSYVIHYIFQIVFKDILQKMEKTLKIGWIGTGVMGAHMCRHLLNKGFNLTVFNRTKSKAQPLIELGAKWSQPDQLAKNSDVVVLMLGYPKDVEQMCLGENNILSKMKQGSILIDHTTSTPSLAQRIFRQASKSKIATIDAPVSGGDVGARDGKLVTMCGGQKQDIQKARTLFDCYSRSVQHNGGPGKGQHTKMANQIVLAGNMLGMVEGLMYASKMGLDVSQAIQTICSGAASSTSLSVMGPRIVKGNFDPGFYVEHYIKDMEIALEEAARANLCLPCLSLVKQFYLSLKAHGGGRLGTQALIKVYQQMNNYKINEQKKE